MALGKSLGFSGHQFAYLLYKVMVLEGGLNKRIFKALSNYMLVWGERHLKECLFVSVNSLKSSLKNGINIKSKALTVFFFFSC